MTRHSDIARQRLEAEQQERINQAREERGLKLLPTKIPEWVVDQEKEKMIDDLMDLVGAVREILQSKDRAKVAKALALLGEVAE